jgi:hypothetical protein
VDGLWPRPVSVSTSSSSRTRCCEHVFDRRQGGAPGLAPGGAVAAACDDLFGFLLYTVGEPAVTRSLEIGYRRPVELGVPYRIRAGSSAAKDDACT